jgi:hypothetical protein
MLDKLSRAEEQLSSLILYHQSNPSYMEKRDNDSVMSFQHRLDALNREEEEAVAKFREQFRARRDNIQRRLEEAKQRQEIHKTTKPKVIHAAETAVKLILMEMDSNGLLSPKDRQRLWELRGEQQPPSNTEPATPPPPPKEEELPQDVKEYLAERGTMPANREELDLFKERKAMLQEMAREKRERERQEEEKRLQAIEEKKLAEEAARQKQAAKKDEVEESSSDTDSESEEEEEDDGYDSEEYRIMLQKQKETLKRQHEERLKRKAAIYTPPPPPPPQEFPKILVNTKTKKMIKIIKK